MRSVICYLLLIYWIILLVKVLSSWFRRPMSGPIRSALNLVDRVTDPVLRPLRGILPPVRAGAIGFDLSPILAFVIIAVLQRAICG